MADVEAIAEKKAGFVKPEKPDEATYHAELKKAEKDHADVMARFVSVFHRSSTMRECFSFSASCMASHGH